MQTIPKLTIQHNHGTIVMRDVTVEEYTSTDYSLGNCNGRQIVYRKVTGMPVSGGWTSRLFTATSFTPVDTTKPYTENIWGHKILQHHNAADGEYFVDVTFCG